MENKTLSTPYLYKRFEREPRHYPLCQGRIWNERGSRVVGCYSYLKQRLLNYAAENTHHHNNSCQIFYPIQYPRYKTAPY